MQKILLILLPLILLASCTNGTNPPSSSKTESSPIETASSTSKDATPKVLIDAPTYGSGTHQIEYYADFQCPACIRFAQIYLPILEEFADSGKVVITYKQYPLTSIHKNAYRDALAFYCATEQGQFMAYKKSLYALEEKKSGASVSDEDRINATEGITLDTEQFAACLKSDKYRSSVDRDMADGDAARVNATPTVILDGTKLDFAIFSDVESFRNTMDRVFSSENP